MSDGPPSVQLLPIASSIEAVFGHHLFPDVLVDARARDAIRAEVAAMPTAAVASGFECRLGEGSAAVDFASLVRRDDGGCAVLCALDPKEHELLLREPAWRQLAAFCERWACPNSWLARTVPFIILEYDVVPREAPVPIPSVFVRVMTGPDLGSFDPAATNRDVEAREGIRILESLLAAPLASDVRDVLYRCYTRLPEGGRFLQAAAMLSREDVVRLYAVLPAPRLERYLGEIGWEGDAAEIARLCLRYGVDGARAEIQLDVSSRVGSRISIEQTFSTLPQDMRTPRAARILDRLVEDGLCAPAKRDAFLAWPKIYRTPLQEGGWPCTITQELSHVKVAYTAGQPLEAKGYFFFTPRMRLFG